MNSLLDYLSIPADDSQFYMYGRNALYALLSMLKDAGRSAIAYPAYSCGDEIAPAAELAYDIHFYPITRTLEVDTDLTLLFKQIDILVITHYFGIVSTHTKALIRLARKYNIIVIEDCAYSLFNQETGSMGDYAIYSLRKHLPVPHGGILKRACAPSPLPSSPLLPSTIAVALEFETFNAYSEGRFRLGSGVHLSKSDNPFGARLKDFGGYNLGISSQAMTMIDTLNIPNHVAHRGYEFDRLYEFFDHRLSSDALIFARQMPNTSRTSFFPLYVPNNADIVHAHLLQKDISAIPFWNRCHPYIDWGSYNEARLLKQSILSLPLTGNYSTHNLQEIADDLRHYYE
jgi:hypothetical protein